MSIGLFLSIDAEHNRHIAVTVSKVKRITKTFFRIYISNYLDSPISYKTIVVKIAEKVSD